MSETPIPDVDWMERALTAEQDYEDAQESIHELQRRHDYEMNLLRAYNGALENVVEAVILRGKRHGSVCECDEEIRRFLVYADEVDHQTRWRVRSDESVPSV